MRIRFVRDIKDKNGVFEAGSEHDIEATSAYGYVKDGSARKTPEGITRPAQAEEKPGGRRGGKPAGDKE